MTEGENNKIFLPQLVIQRRNYSNRMKKKEREGRLGEREEREREKDKYIYSERIKERKRFRLFNPSCKLFILPTGLHPPPTPPPSLSSPPPLLLPFTVLKH